MDEERLNINDFEVSDELFDQCAVDVSKEYWSKVDCNGKQPHFVDKDKEPVLLWRIYRWFLGVFLGKEVIEVITGRKITEADVAAKLEEIRRMIKDEQI